MCPRKSHKISWLQSFMICMREARSKRLMYTLASWMERCGRGLSKFEDSPLRPL